MRMWGKHSEPSVDLGADDVARLAAWEGLAGRSGPSVVIRAVRAGDAVEHDANRRVA